MKRKNSKEEIIHIDTDFVSKLDGLIKEGKANEVLLLLKKVNRSKVSKKYILDLARMARRIDYPKFGLQLLRPYIIEKLSTEPELEIEYAANLVKMEILDEAKTILKKTSNIEIPQSKLILAFAYFRTWDYKKAIPYLEEFVKLSQNEYQKIIGRLNLAAALVYEKENVRAREELSLVLEYANSTNNKLLMGNTYELLTQLEIQSGHYGIAESFIKNSSDILSKSSIRYRAFVKKWNAITLGLKTNGSYESLKKLKSARRASLYLGEWETVRECDLYLSLFKKDIDLFLKVYFGTPFTAYRNRAVKLFNKKLVIPDNYLIHCGNFDTEIDIRDTIKVNSQSLIKRDHLICKVIKILYSDRYKPFGVGSLFSQLFPDDFFNPETAHHRVYEAIRRSREWIDKNGLPVQIEIANSGYRIKFNEGVGIRVGKENSALLSLIDRIIEEFGDRPFSSAEAIQKLKIPQTTLIRKLNCEVTSGKLFKEGKGKNTRYVISSSIKEAS